MSDGLIRLFALGFLAAGFALGWADWPSSEETKPTPSVERVEIAANAHTN